MSSPDELQLPISGYDRLKDKQITDQLSQLSQVELATVETYERAHGGRPAVLDKLRYMRGSEPLPGYDALTTEQIAKALAGADAETVKAVRDYERKFPLDFDGYADPARTRVEPGPDRATISTLIEWERKFGRRQSVLDEAARVLPTATASAGEERAREQQTALVREGFAGRAKTARDLPG